MDEKEYTVTISSKEYRELITLGVKSEAEREKIQSQYWDAHSRASKAEVALKESQKAVENYAKFISSDPMISQAYARYIAPKVEEE